MKNMNNFQITKVQPQGVDFLTSVAYKGIKKGVLL